MRLHANDRLRSTLADGKPYGYIRRTADAIAEHDPALAGSVRDPHRWLSLVLNTAGKQTPARWAVALVREAERDPAMSEEAARVLFVRYFDVRG